MTTETKQITAYDAFYMGRNDAHNGFTPEHQRAGEFRDDYRRGYRQVKAEDALDADTEWDDD